MDFSPGDVVVIIPPAVYVYTTPGSIGTIRKAEDRHSYLVEFRPGIDNPYYKSADVDVFSISKKYLSFLEDYKPVTIQEKICKKIKQLDTQYVNKQLQKGNKVCDAFHAIVS